MKFAFVAVVLCSILPLSLLLQRYAVVNRGFWIFFGAAPFFLASVPLFDIGLVSWGGRWIGFVYGMELSILDFLALAAFFSLPRQRTPVVYFLPFALYLAAAALSMLQAAEPLAAFFGVWQFFRMFFIAVVVARACAYEEVPYLLLRGMAVGIAVQFLTVLWQRFGEGLSQTPGLFIHQNTLGMAVHFVLYAHLALLLAGERRFVYVASTVAMTLVTVILTASRGAVGVAALFTALTFAGMALAGLTRRKVAVMAVGLLALLAIAPLAVSSFQNRFANDPLQEDAYDERAAFNRAARYILQDHPLGIGMNHYVLIARDLGYSERAGVAVAEGNRNNIVHNAYFLTGAETGYPGLVAFALMLATPLLLALSGGWRLRNTPRGTLLYGCAMALAAACVHSAYEWILFGKEVQYLLAIVMGMTFALASSRQSVRERSPLPGAGSGMLANHS